MKPARAAPPGRPGRGRDLRGFSLRDKLLALLVLIAVAPAVTATALLVTVNRDAVVLSETQLQHAVLAELAATAVVEVRTAEDDLRAVAVALGEAARSGTRADAVSGTDAVKALLATRRHIAAVRFEVPEAQFSTELRREGAPARPVPAASAALRARADERGVAFALQPDGQALLVVPVPHAVRRGYVSAELELDALAAALETAATTRFEGGTASLVLADADRRAVAVHGVPGLKRGGDAARLAVWRVLPDGTPWSTRLGAVTRWELGPEPVVGGVETVPDLGWAVALWRPETAAFASLTAMRQRGAAVAVGSLLLAVIAAFFASGALTRPILRLVSQARLVGERRWRELGAPASRGDEIGQLDRAIGRMADALEAGEAEIAREARLRGDLGRYLSREVVDAILRGEHRLELGGHRAPVSVLFADVVAFTTLAESRPPEQVVALLNELFSMLTEVVFRHGGTVDKYIGDCLMAVWGAPTPRADHGVAAVSAAEDMLRFLESANPGWLERYGVELRLAIGVHSGDAVVGNVGSEKRMEYTAMGDTVNIAARLESAASPNQVLLSAATAALLGDRFDLVDLGERQLPGKEAAIHVFALASGG